MRQFDQRSSHTPHIALRIFARQKLSSAGYNQNTMVLGWVILELRSSGAVQYGLHIT